MTSGLKVMHRHAVVLSVCVIVAACGAVVDEPPVDQTPTLINEDFRIIEMATAHGAFTIEVEVSCKADTSAIARTLIEPLQARYAEILVYFYEQDDNAALPTSRTQWTAADGYREILY